MSKLIIFDDWATLGPIVSKTIARKGPEIDITGVEQFTTLDEALQIIPQLNSTQIFAVLLDGNLQPGSTNNSCGISLRRALEEYHPGVPVFDISSSNDLAKDSGLPFNGSIPKTEIVNQLVPVLMALPHTSAE